MIERYLRKAGALRPNPWPANAQLDDDSLADLGWKLIYRIGAPGEEALQVRLYIAEQVDDLITPAAKEGAWLARIRLGEYYSVADVVCGTGLDLIWLLCDLRPLQSLQYRYDGMGGQ